MSSRLYLINDVPTAVRHNLEGIVRVNNHLVIHKSSNIVVRKDFRESVLDKAKVSLISGGGSGHEPSHAGFVGSGLLTASVSGNIFASPTAAEVLRTIKLINLKNCSAGTLLIVPNYTGDRLHFGSAKERAVLEGYNVDLFIFGDDCVFGSKTGRVGKRGLAGVFFIHKIAGALAEDGVSLKAIKQSVELAAPRIASISISLGPCNVPGVGPSFVMPPGQLEVGLGIHGERGSKRIPYIPAGQAVSLLIDHLTSEEVGLKKYFSSNGSTRIVILFNDNGGMTTMEMNVIMREAISQFTSRGFTIERTYSGRYVTSFDMIGVCLSIMVVDDDLLKLLDAPCSSVIISQESSLPRGINSEPMLDDDEDDSVRERMALNYDKIDRLIAYESIFIKCLSSACQTLIDNESYLNRLDSETGDSDCGSTLASGARTLLEAIESGNLKSSFLQLSHIIEKCMGGTSGALFSLFFTGASKSVATQLSNNSGRLNIQSWTEIISQSINNMTQYSYARPGDRTMVDPLNSLVKAFSSYSDSENNISTFLAHVLLKVESDAQSTASMEAKIGRASYAPKLSNSGPDPGAWAIYLIVKAIFDTYLESTQQ